MGTRYRAAARDAPRQSDYPSRRSTAVARHLASGSKFLLPSRYDTDRGMSMATLDRVTRAAPEKDREEKLRLEP